MRVGGVNRTANTRVCFADGAKADTHPSCMCASEWQTWKTKVPVLFVSVRDVEPAAKSPQRLQRRAGTTTEQYTPANVVWISTSVPFRDGRSIFRNSRGSPKFTTALIKRGVKRTTVVRLRTHPPHEIMPNVAPRSFLHRPFLRYKGSLSSNDQRMVRFIAVTRIVTWVCITAHG